MRIVDRAKFVEQNIGGPAVANDVVAGENQGMQIRFEAEETQPQYGAVYQIKWSRRFAVLGALQSGITL